MVKLAVHVTPRATRDEVVGWRGDELAVRVTAAPDGGKANVTACKVIARAAGVSGSAVRVLRGASSRHKMIEIEGLDSSDIEACFGAPGSDALPPGG